MSQVQSDHGHYETLWSQDPALGKSQYQTFEHFVADSAASFPKQRSKIVAGRLCGVHTLFEFLERYLWVKTQKQNTQL